MTQSKTIDLAHLVETCTEEMVSWALYKVADKELARDLVQDTFLAAAEKVGSFKGDSSPKTWLFSILNHKITDVYRKKPKQPVRMDGRLLSAFFDGEGNWQQNRIPKDWHEGEHLLDDSEFQQILQQCLDALPEKWNICVKMKYLAERNGEEICQELGITATNFWQIVHRAKLQLRDCIELNWFIS
jgi:RNA polymerase sigma-70 factor (ECF subfamily)